MNNGSKNLNLKNAHDKKQLEKMVEITKHGVCPFCPKYLKKYHDTPIIKVGENWIITSNDYPYKGTKYHFLLITKKHLNKITQLKPELMVELSKQINWLVKKYKIPGASLVFRFGDTNYTGGTVDHLHCHLIVGGKGSTKKEKILGALGYQK